MGRLKGQAAIVVGASSGMGRATALAFAAEGAKVAVAARRKGELDALVAEIAKRGGEAVALAADVSKRADVDAVVQAAVERFGRLDVLVNCAGVNAQNRQLASLDQAGWDRIIGINLTGALHCTQAVAAEDAGAEGRAHHPYRIHLGPLGGLLGRGVSGE